MQLHLLYNQSPSPQLQRPPTSPRGSTEIPTQLSLLVKRQMPWKTYMLDCPSPLTRRYSSQQHPRPLPKTVTTRHRAFILCILKSAQLNQRYFRFAGKSKAKETPSFLLDEPSPKKTTPWEQPTKVRSSITPSTIPSEPVQVIKPPSNFKTPSTGAFPWESADRRPAVKIAVAKPASFLDDDGLESESV